MRDAAKKAIIRVLEEYGCEVADPETGSLCLRVGVNDAGKIVDALVAAEEAEGSAQLALMYSA